MKRNTMTKQQLLLEMEELRTRLDATEQRLKGANEVLQAQMAEHKRAEDALEKTQQYAQSIVETIREPLVVLTADLKVILANRSFYQTFKVSPEETEGQFIYSVGNHQWDIPVLRKLLEEIVPQNTHFNDFKVDHEFPAIGRRTMLLNARRIYREGKGTEMILLAIEDITERKQTEEALKISETRYRRLFETAQDGILILDADTGQISDVNPFLVEMLGYSHEDLLGKKLWEIGAFKDIEASKAAFSELQNKGYVRYEDLPLQTKDRRHIDMEFVSYAYLVDHKKVIQCNIRDITQRNQAEDELRQKTHELGERVKELNCLYAFSNPIEKPDICLPEVFQGLVDIIPSGWQYPEMTCARLVLEDQIFKTANFMETIWKQSSPILVDGRHRGDLEVYYLEGKPEFEEGSFLKKERNLIYALASRLGKTIKRIWTEEALEVSNRFLQIINKQIGMTPLLKEFLVEVRNLTGCSAMGVRLLDDAGNIPYQAYEGFSQEFYQKESPLSIKSDQCICINVIKGEIDPTLPFYTAGGSFYINATSRFLATVSEKEKGKTRNECNRVGFESVALVPIPIGDGIQGLIHVADPRENMVPLKMVELLERVSMQLGTGIRRVQAEEALQRSRDELEMRVQERTTELAKINEELQVEIAERKHAEEALRESETKYRIVADNTYDWELWLSPQGHFIYVSPSCKRITGHGSEEFLRDPGLLFRIIHPDDLSTYFHHQSQIEQKPTSGEVEFRVLHTDGSYRWISHVCQPVFDREGNFLGRRGSNRDITERKLAEEALQESEHRLRLLSSQLLAAQETERKRVARELHDGIGQTLTAIKFKIEDTLLEKGRGKSVSKKTSLETLNQMVKKSIEEVRRIQMDLRPSTLDDLGILATISWFTREFGKIYSSFHIEKRIDLQEDEVPDSLKTIIFRVIQESLNNTAKHSKADLVHLSLQKTDGGIELRIEDNGMGFDLESTLSLKSDGRGFGLSSMRERVEHSDGSFAVESTKGKGTLIQASWPLQQK